MCVMLLALSVAACGGSSVRAAKPTGTHHPSSTSASDATSTSLSPGTVGPMGGGPGINVYAETGADALSPKVANIPTRVYVPNSVSNTVDVIDPNTF